MDIILNSGPVNCILFIIANTSLIPCSRVLLEKLILAQSVKNFPQFSGS
jgi:hypothetical protein